MGALRHDVGVDTAVAPAVPSVQRAAEDQLMSETALTAESHVATVGDYFALLKPRVMSLVVFTGLAGVVSAPGGIHLLTAFTALLCIAVAAGASGALNMAYESDIDALMSRTAGRPIPSGRITRGGALGFGWMLAAGAGAR